jgi:hypothetical protein
MAVSWENIAIRRHRWRLFMGRKTDDYYILFRDTDVPKPFDSQYEKRCRLQDLLIGDRAAYVWGYVGKLDSNQAELVKKSLDSTVNERFSFEHRSSAISLNDREESDFMLNQRGEIRVIPRTPDSLDFLSQVSPNLCFFSYVPLNRCVRIYPESSKEKRQILDALTSHESQNNFGFELHYDPQKKDSPLRHRSFVYLLSLKTITEMWQRIDFCASKQLLFRQIAGICVVETFEKSTIDASSMDFYKTERKKVRPENVENYFRSLVLNKKTYYPKFSLLQLEVLEECVDIANIIMGEGSCINRYKIAKHKKIRKENRKLFHKELLRLHKRNSVGPKAAPQPAAEEKPKRKPKRKLKPPPEPANTKRDARILELRQMDIPFKEVCNTINKEFKGEMLDEKSAGEALRRYCDRNHIEYPHGKRGRKPTT